MSYLSVLGSESREFFIRNPSVFFPSFNLNKESGTKFEAI